MEDCVEVGQSLEVIVGGVALVEGKEAVHPQVEVLAPMGWVPLTEQLEVVVGEVHEVLLYAGKSEMAVVDQLVYLGHSLKHVE